MGKATVQELGELHSLLCQWGKEKLLEKVPINVMTPEGPVFSGEYAKAAKAADFNAIRAFLSDNNITADLNTNKGLQDLKKTLGQQTRHSDNVVQMPDPHAAASEIQGMKYGNE